MFLPVSILIGPDTYFTNVLIFLPLFLALLKILSMWVDHFPHIKVLFLQLCRCTSLLPSCNSLFSSLQQLPSQKTVVVEAGKKQKTPKKRKKKDPNEPQKPVSAYALFFRDTQAAIKGQNPNATFGEVSKIVASMWDSLGEEQKQVSK